MAHRYLFLCPDRKTASGGIAVIYDLVALLNRAGYEAAIVHNSAQAGYFDRTVEVPMFYTERMNKVSIPHMQSRKGRLRAYLASVRRYLTPGGLNALEMRAGDVIVSPEFMLDDALDAFSDTPVCVFVQNPFSLVRAFTRSLKRGRDPRELVSHWFGMSQICRSYIEMLELDPVSYFPVSMKPEDFTFQTHTKPIITYMPRKRREEAKVVVDSLKRRGRVSGYDIEALDGLTRKEIAAKLEHSRIFVSFLNKESLGFPAAEAMASGCLVIGFDGQGGAEFFDETTGYPVVEGDIAALVTQVEDVVALYETNPSQFEALQRHASTRVRERYSVEAFEEGALQTWSALQHSLPPSP